MTTDMTTGTYDDTASPFTNTATDISGDSGDISGDISGDPASPLTKRAEAFCAAYARRPHGADAAREAGYAAATAARQASRLLIQPQILARIAELSPGGGDLRAELAGDLIGKLTPVYDAALAAGDMDTVLQTVELQARILGLVHGGATVRPRSGGSGSQAGRWPTHEEALAQLA